MRLFSHYRVKLEFVKHLIHAAVSASFMGCGTINSLQYNNCFLLSYNVVDLFEIWHVASMSGREAVYETKLHCRWQTALLLNLIYPKNCRTHVLAYKLYRGFNLILQAVMLIFKTIMCLP